jgi:hypothetical protein
MNDLIITMQKHQLAQRLIRFLLDRFSGCAKKNENRGKTDDVMCCISMNITAKITKGKS